MEKNKNLFEYYILTMYVSKKNWVINYLGNELSSEHFTAVMYELGYNGWELVSSIPINTGSVQNTALIPIRADTTVGLSETTQIEYIFKRKVSSEDLLNNYIEDDYLKNVRNITDNMGNKMEEEAIKQKNKRDILNKNISSLEDILEFVESSLLENSFVEGETLLNANKSYYQTRITSQENKGMFKTTTVEFEVEIRVDIFIDKEKGQVITRQYQKSGTSSWTHYQDLNVDSQEESKKLFLDEYKI